MALPRTSLWILAAAIALPGLAPADEIYRWVDEQGRVHFSATPPAQGQARAEEWKAKDEKRVQIAPEAAGAALPRPAPEPSSAWNGTVPSVPSRKKPDAEPSYIGGYSKSGWQSRYRSKQAAVESARQAVERAQDRDRTARWGRTLRDTRRHVDRAEERVRKAEEELFDFMQDARRQGVPAGWLRD